MKTIIRSITVIALVLLAVFASACTVERSAPVEAAELHGPESCDVVASGPVGQAWQFSNHDTAAPVGFSCVSLGGGMFKCDPDACLVLPYTGTCPHCGGGGE